MVSVKKDGQSNVHVVNLPETKKQRKGKGKYTQICNYLEFLPPDVKNNQTVEITLRKMADLFDYYDFNNLKTLFDRKDCLSYNTVQISGKNKNIYYAKHSKPRHYALIAKKNENKEHGHDVGGMVSKNVHVVENEFIAHLKKSEKFKEYLDYEVHGLKYLSPPNIVACDPSIFINEVVKWEYCNFTINVNEGRILVFTQVGKYKKYALNKARYKEFIEFRNKKINELLGFDAHYYLEIIQFDLNQDNHLFEWKGKWQGIHIIAGLCEEYKITVQRYKVQRLEHPIAPSNQWIKRFEVRFKTRKTIQDLSRIIPDLLTLEADHVAAFTNIESLVNHWVSTQTNLEKTINEFVPRVFEFISEIEDFAQSPDRFDNVDNFHIKLSKFKEEIVHVLSTKHLNPLEERLENRVDSLHKEVSTLSTYVLKNIEAYENELELRVDIFVAYTEHKQSLREIGNQIGRSHEFVRGKLNEAIEIMDRENIDQSDFRTLMSETMSNQTKILGQSKKDTDLIKDGVDNVYTLIEESTNEIMTQSASLVMITKPQTRTEPERIFISVDTNLRDRILNELKNNPGLNSKELRSALRVNNKKLTEHLIHLANIDKIVNTNHGKGHAWELA